MEVKCKVCGTINDGETNFCKGCFVKLDKEIPVENNYNPKEKEITVPIEEVKEIEVPWIENDSVQKELKPIVEQASETDNYWEQPELKPINELEEINNLDKNNIIFEPMVENYSINDEPTDLDNIEPMKEEVESIVDQSIEDSIPEPVAIEIPTEEKATNSIDEQSVEETIPEIEEIELPVEEKEIESIIEQPIEESNQLETETILETEPEKKSNVMMSIIDDNGNNQIVEDSIPELSDNNDDQTTSLPELDMKQFEIDDQKESDSSWVDEVEEIEPVDMKYSYVGVGKLILKYFIYCAIFGVIFGAICIGFRYAMTNIFNMGNRGELIFIVISSVTSVATLLLAADRTLKKTIPLASKINEASIMMLMLIAVPYLLIKIVYNLYIGTTLVTLLIVVALSLLILAIFLNYLRGNIRHKHELKNEDKISFIYGVISIVLVLGLLTFTYMYRDKDYDISLDILMNDTKNKETVMEYIYQVEKTILKNQTEKDGYVIPNVIGDVNYAEIDGKTPTEMTLYINENGGVKSGTIVYKGKTYKYNGKNIEA